MKKVLKEKKYLILLIIILLLSSIPLFKPNLNYGDDLGFHLFRIKELTNLLKNGMFFYPIYNGVLYDYGYGVGLFYPDLFLYIPATIYLITKNLTFSYKFFIFIINIATLYTTFYSTNKLVKNKNISIITTLLFMLNPYRLSSIYLHASLGKVLSCIFVPLTIYGLYEIINENYKKNYIFIIGLAGTILSHVISSIISFIFIIIFIIINHKKLIKERIKYLVFSICLVFLITSYFTLPLLEQLLDNNFQLLYSGYNWQLNKTALSPTELFFEFNNSLLITIGISLTISLILFAINYKNLTKTTKQFYFLGIFFMILTTNIIPWFLVDKYKNIAYKDIINNTNSIFLKIGALQFPWRFLFIAVPLLVFGYTLLLKEINKKKLINKVLIITSISLSISSIFISLNNNKIYQEEKKILYDWGEYLPLHTNINKIKKDKGIISPNNKVKILKKRRKKNKLIIKYKANTNTKIELPLVYYKGYQASLNNKREKIFITKNNLVGMNINRKSGTIVIEYKNTITTYIGKILSIFGIIIFIILLKKEQLIYKNKLL